MVRYRDDDDSRSSRALLITAGVAAGLLAGAVVAQRLGGWQGMRRLMLHRRSPLRAALGRVLPAGIVTTLLDTIGIEEIVRALTEERRRSPLRRRRRQHDLDLDEYELDEVERATAGLDDDEEPRALRARDDELVDEDEGEADEANLVDEIVDDADADEEVDVMDADEDDADEDVTDEDVTDDELGDEEDEIVESATPEEIEAAALAAFRRHPVLRRRALEIAVDDEGVLELGGWVRNERDLRIARRVAARVPGVERVVVNVAVRDGVLDGVLERARQGARDGVRVDTERTRA